MGDQPYQFGDIVDGYRWTITGWEPVEAPERTVGVPRLLEKRYAATQEKQAREQARQDAPTQTLEEPALVVVEDDPVAEATSPEPDLMPSLVLEPDQADEPTAHGALDEVPEVQQPDQVDTAVDQVVVLDQEPAPLTLDEILGGGRTVVAAPDLAVTFDDPEPAPYADQSDEPGQTHEATQEASGSAEPFDARPASARAWYGLGLEPIEEAEEPQEQEEEPIAPPADDAFAAALELGARTFAEHYQPSEIEIAAGIASGARRPVDAWAAPSPAPSDPWAADDTSVAPEVLDPLDAAYGSTAAVSQEPTDEPSDESAPAPRPVTFSAPPAAGWYPGSV